MSRTIGLLAAFIAAQVTLAGAAEIKVFSTIGVKSVLEELIPKFEMSSGHKLDVTWSTAALLAKRVESGEQADAVILIENNVETLLKGGKIVPGTDALFGQSIFAVGVRAGAPKPDISTPDAFKQSLLAAKGSAIPTRPQGARAVSISQNRSNAWASQGN
jgi:molybdate transport system substrate-binding protein